jgi:hypothetical protein
MCLSFIKHRRVAELLKQGNRPSIYKVLDSNTHQYLISFDLSNGSKFLYFIGRRNLGYAISSKSFSKHWEPLLSPLTRHQWILEKLYRVNQ